MFDKLNVDDVTSIKNSICENDSNNNEFEFVKFKKTKSFKKIEQLNIILSNNYFRVNANENSLLIKELKAIFER